MTSTRVLYISDSIGLGHAARDLAIARELRALNPESRSCGSQASPQGGSSPRQERLSSPRPRPSPTKPVLPRTPLGSSPSTSFATLERLMAYRSAPLHLSGPSRSQPISMMPSIGASYELPRNTWRRSQNMSSRL